MFNLLYINNTDTLLADNVYQKYNDTYYGSFYDFYSKKISRDDFISKLTNLFDNALPYTTDLKIKLFNWYCNKNDLFFCSDIVYNTITNPTYIPDPTLRQLYCEFNDKCLYEMYIDYYDEIFNNFNCSKHPVELILNNKKIYVYEGIHRIIFCVIKQINFTFVIKKCTCDVFKYILDTIYSDYDEMYKKNSKKFIMYNPIDHPLFENIPHIRKNRMPAIIDYLSQKNYLKGLEVGCQNGFATYELAKNGYLMEAIDYDDKYIKLFTMIGQILNLNVNITRQDISIYPIDKQFDFIVCLSVLYHIKRNSFENFNNCLKNLFQCSKCLIVDDELSTMHLTLEDYKSILDKGEFQYDVKLLDDSDPIRNIYVITNQSII